METIDADCCCPDADDCSSEVCIGGTEGLQGDKPRGRSRPRETEEELFCAEDYFATLETLFNTKDQGNKHVISTGQRRKGTMAIKMLRNHIRTLEKEVTMLRIKESLATTIHKKINEIHGVVTAKIKEPTEQAPVQEQPRPTYAEKLKGRTTHTVLVKAKDDKVPPQKLAESLKKKINPVEEGIKVKKLRTTRQGVAIDVESSKDAERMNELLTSTKDLDVQAKTAKKKKPKIILHNVDKATDEETIIRGIREQFEAKTEDVKVVVRLKCRENFSASNWVIELHPRVFAALMSTRRLVLPWRVVTVSEYLRPPRCFRCQEFGHISRHCSSKRPALCAYCGDPHDTRACKSKRKEDCVNCHVLNSKWNLELRTDHPAFHRDCPAFQQAKEDLRRQTDYSF